MRHSDWHYDTSPLTLGWSPFPTKEWQVKVNSGVSFNKGGNPSVDCWREGYSGITIRVDAPITGHGHMVKNQLETARSAYFTGCLCRILSIKSMPEIQQVSILKIRILPFWTSIKQIMLPLTTSIQKLCPEIFFGWPKRSRSSARHSCEGRRWRRQARDRLKVHHE